MKKETYVLTKAAALLFLYNEFSTDNLKLIVEVDEDGCFENHIEVEGTQERSLDSEYLGYLVDCAKQMERAKAERMSKWLYRLESRNPNNGLWYNTNNEYVWGCKDCKGEAKNLPMGYDERYHIDGKNWFSSCSNKEDLLHWYSKEDAKYLIENGFVFTRYLAVDYHEFALETVFLKETCLAREEISFEELFKEKDA